MSNENDKAWADVARYIHSDEARGKFWRKHFAKKCAASDTLIHGGEGASWQTEVVAPKGTDGKD